MVEVEAGRLGRPATCCPAAPGKIRRRPRRHCLNAELHGLPQEPHDESPRTAARGSARWLAEAATRVEGLQAGTPSEEERAWLRSCASYSRPGRGTKFNLVATNVQVTPTSEHYETRRACRAGIESVRKDAPTADLDDATAKTN